ncbi:4141_t:CDS:2 [Diversispora eburnea]|uniref:Protein phosphatase n=1 Tax=Diversispora eburnea TaxID=1213867 RepID=A0A9N8YM65_9GLOM|nr:4141_t:CDS:2 [Diversispora eburnea]
MSTPISPFYRPGVFPALSSRLLISASQSLRLAIHSQLLLRSFYNAPLCLTDLPLTATKGFTYLIAASWHPKRKRHTTVNNIPNGSGHRWWTENKKVGKVDAGDDAFFYVGTNNGVALGVADGVGGWSQMGVDPAKFSWALMDNAANVAKDFNAFDRLALFNAPHKHGDILDAKQILSGAFDNLMKSGKVKAGSSTACILSLSKTSGILNAATLGDSAYLLIRNGRLLYESPSQQHFFNCPYQLTVVPDHYPNQKLYFKDKPSDAYQVSHQLQDGDVLLLATDGFFDNVFTEEAVTIVNTELQDIMGQDKKYWGNDYEELRTHVRRLSRRLTDTARRYSLDPLRVSPFSQSAKKSGEFRAGGKVDDITVLVTLVQAN